jgi:hypothetical protein
MEATMAITLPYLRSPDKHHHRGLSTMAYILLFAAATFCALVTMFVLLARHPAQTVPVEPMKPSSSDTRTQFG